MIEALADGLAGLISSLIVGWLGTRSVLRLRSRVLHRVGRVSPQRRGLDGRRTCTSSGLRIWPGLGVLCETPAGFVQTIGSSDRGPHLRWRGERPVSRPRGVYIDARKGDEAATAGKSSRRGVPRRHDTGGAAIVNIKNWRTL